MIGQIVVIAAQPTKKRKHEAYTASDKAWLLDYFDRNPRVSAQELGVRLADHVNSKRTADQVEKPAPGKAPVNDWKKAAVSIRAMAAGEASAAGTRNCAAKHPRMEEALHLWFRTQEQRDLVITDELLINQAKLFGAQCEVPEAFAFSRGWLQGFKKRWGIRSYALHGEAGDANMEGVALARANLPLLLEAGGYTADTTYYQDETGLLWRQVPTRTHASSRKAGKKTEKERVTVSLTCNASGTDKRQLFLIGKAKRPRSFPKKFQPSRDLAPKGVRYANNKTAWMTTHEFSKWLLDWNAALRG